MGRFDLWHLIGCTDCSSCVTICKNKNDYGIKQYPIIPHHILRPSFIAISGCRHSMREQQQSRALAKNESIMRHQNRDRASISAGCASKNERLRMHRDHFCKMPCKHRAFPHLQRRRHCLPRHTHAVSTPYGAASLQGGGPEPQDLKQAEGCRRAALAPWGGSFYAAPWSHPCAS